MRFLKLFASMVALTLICVVFLVFAGAIKTPLLPAPGNAREFGATIGAWLFLLLVSTLAGAISLFLTRKRIETSAPYVAGAVVALIFTALNLIGGR